MEAAEWQVKFNTLLLSYGVERIIYHSGTIGSLNNEDLAGIFFEWAGTPRKMLVTQSALANLLVPPVRPLGRLASPPDTAAYGFESQGRTVIVAWAIEEAKPATVSIAGKGWKAVDLQGNQLNTESVRRDRTARVFRDREDQARNASLAVARHWRVSPRYG